MRRIVIGWTVIVLVFGAAGFSAQQGAGAVTTEFNSDRGGEDRMELLQGAERFVWQRPDIVMRLLAVRDGDKVADLGAGSGLFVRMLTNYAGTNGEVYALEMVPELILLLEEEREKSPLFHIKPRLVREQDLGLPQGELDLVLTVNHWHRFGDRASVRGQIESALRPGGRLAIVDWLDGEFALAPPPARRLARETVIKELEAAGWTLTTESRALEHQYLLVFRRP